MKVLKRNNLIVVLVAFLLIVGINIGVAEASWSYTVKSGDTLWSISQRFGTSVNAIKRVSGNWSNVIVPGQRLSIPGGTNSSGVSTADKELLARVVEAEATAESYKGKVGVAAVVLNRVDHHSFPDSLRSVIYQKHAFETVTNNRIWQVRPTQETYRAVQDAINGWDPSYNSLFFWNPAKVSGSSWIWTRNIVSTIGNHAFAH